MTTFTAGVGLPMPKPSYSFFVASSRGERGNSPMEEAERGVVGEEREIEDEVEYPSSAREELVVVSPEESVGELLSTARTGRG